MSEVLVACRVAAEANAFVGPCPEDKRQWQVIADGESIDVGNVLIVNPNIGVAIALGMRPEGYQGPVIREAKGGGEVSLPYFRHPDTGVLWVGLLMESRPNMGGAALCAVGGLNAAGLTRDETMVKEGQEEGGFTAEPEILPGELINANRLLVLADYRKDEGIRVGGLEVPFSAVTFEDGITTEAHFAEGTTFGKKPGAVIFKPWQVAIGETADGIALAAIARLLSHLG